jgi:WD40 repeat protein
VRFRNARAACFLPDGKSLVGCSYGQLHLFDVASGKNAADFPKDVGDTWWEKIVVSADGLLTAAVGRGTRTVGVWELTSGKQLHKLEMPEGDGHFDCDSGVAFSPDSKVLSAAEQWTTCSWDLTTGKRISQFKHSDHKDGRSVMTVFSSDGHYLAVGDGEKAIPVWDVSAGKLLHRLDGHEHGIWCGAFSSDGKTLATGGYTDKTIRIWDVASGTQLRQLKVHCEHVTGVAFSPDLKQVAAATRTDLLGDVVREDQVNLWDLSATEDAPRIVPLPEVRWVRYSPDGKTLACGCSCNSVCLFDPASGKEIRPLDAHRGGVWRVAYSPDGTTLATASEDYTVRLWDAVTGKPLRTLAGHTNHVRALAFSPDGTRLATGAYDGTALLWDVSTGARKQTLKTSDGVRAVRLWSGGKTLQDVKGNDDFLGLPVFSPDGKLVADGIKGDFRVRDAATGQVMRSFTGLCERSTVAFSPDGRTLAAATNEGVVLWEMLTGEERARFPPKASGWGSSLTFAPNGRTLAFQDRGVSMSAGPQLLVWDLATRQELGPFRGHRGDVNALAFSPDGSRIATASDDTTVLIWDLGVHKRR